jgi:cytochrome c-type biogenesis protein CcmH/NrfF
LLAPAPPDKDGRPEQILSELSNDLMSPYCPGRTIASCPSEQARKLEDHILAQAQAGKSRKEIEQDLVSQFGQEIVGYAPQPLLLYGVLGAGIAGLMVVAWVGRKWMRPRPAAAAGAAGAAAAAVGGSAAGSSAKAAKPSAAERERLEDALDDLDEF